MYLSFLSGFPPAHSPEPQALGASPVTPPSLSLPRAALFKEELPDGWECFVTSLGAVRSQCVLPNQGAFPPLLHDG